MFKILTFCSLGLFLISLKTQLQTMRGLICYTIPGSVVKLITCENKLSDKLD